MRRRRTILVDLVIAAALAGAVLAIAALANSADKAYPTRWDAKKVEYRFSGELRGDLKSPVVRAAKKWNKVHASMSFDKARGKAQAYPQTECGDHYQDNVITERSLDGPLGFTTWCLFDGTSEIYSFQIALEEDKNWYTGNGKPDADQWDAFAVTLHELGHASGRSDHYPEGSPQCEDPPGETMCPALAEGDTRGLGKTDKKTFNQAY